MTLEEGDERYKLLLTQTDKETLLAIVDDRRLPDPSSNRILENFNFFAERIKELGSDVGQLCEGLAKLTLVEISLSRGDDNPQLIFESMNSTGLALSQADLIRNYVLMDLEPARQARLYKEILASHGACLRPGFLRHALRRLHAPLPDIQDWRNPQ